MKKKLCMAYERLQALQIPPTKTNMVILMGVLQTIEEAVKYIAEQEGGKTDDGTASEGRDNHQ